MEAERGKAKRVEHYLTEDFNPNCTLKTKITPLYTAVAKRHIKTVEALLSCSKIDVNQVRDTGATPFFMATQKEHIEVVEMLLKRGADPNLVRSSDGCAPIAMAIHKQNIEITKLLIEEVDLDKNIWKGKTIEVFIEEKITNESSKQELLTAVRKKREEQSKLTEAEQETSPSSEISKAEYLKSLYLSRYLPPF